MPPQGAASWEQSRITASMARRRDPLAFSDSEPFPFPQVSIRDHPWKQRKQGKVHPITLVGL